MKEDAGLELGLGIAFTFILSLADQQPSHHLQPASVRELYILSLTSFTGGGPLGQSRLPEATTLRYSLQKEGLLSQACTFFWSVLSGYYQIETVAVDVCCLITVC